MAESAETKTYCVGRYLIDIPVEFKMIEQGGSVKDVNIERLGPGNERDLEWMISNRIQSLKSGAVVEDTIKQIFRSVEQLGHFKVITRVSDLPFKGIKPDEFGWKEEIFALSDGVIFRLYGVGTKEKLSYYRENMRLVAENIHPLNHGHPPKGQGTCLKNSFIAVPIGKEVMGANFIKDVDGYRVAFGISVSISEPGGYQILSEVANSNLGEPAEIAGFRGRKERAYGKYMDFQAIVGQKTTKNDFGYQIHLEYYNHHPDNGYFSEIRKKADYDWDIVLNSIRLRR